VKNVTVNTSTAAGIWCYITFLATDATDTDDPNAPKTFQALAWWGVDEKTQVSFCRLKKSSSHEGIPFNMPSSLLLALVICAACLC